MTEPHPFTLTEPFTLDDPLDLSDARQAAHLSAQNRRRVRDALDDQIEIAASAEDVYDRKLKATMIGLREADPPTPATMAKDLAKGTEDVIEARHNRDVQTARVDLLKRELSGLEGERAMLRQLVEMSQQLRVEAARLSRG